MAVETGNPSRHGGARAAQFREPDEIADLGILFVHGIGEQQQGDTLEQGGAALVEWLTDWCAARDGSATVGQAVLIGSRLGPGTPAHAQLNLTVSSNGEQRQSRWLLAESWWATAFNPPGFRELSRWLLTSGSWAIISHVASFCHRSVRGWMNAVRQQDGARPGLLRPLAIARRAMFMGAAGLTWALSFAGSIVAVCLFQLFVVIVSAASLLPIPPLRNTLKALLLKVQGILGDSFVFSTRSIVRGTVVSQVLRDLEWLEERCETSVVIAHSQGAAVSFEALRNLRSTKLARLITYGAGLLKLQELKSHNNSGHWPRLIRYLVLLVPLYLFAVPFMCQALAERFWDSWQGLQKLYGSFQYDTSLLFGRADDLPAFTLFAPLLLFVVIGYVRTVRQESESELEASFRQMQFRPDFRWLDVHSSHDPVPNGPSLSGGVERYQAIEIANRKSLLCDHTAYWENGDGFIPLVVRELNEVSHLPRPVDDGLLAEAASKRRARANWLLCLRCLVILAVAAPILLKAPHVRAFGATRVAPVLSSLSVTPAGNLPDSRAQRAGNSDDLTTILRSGATDVWFWSLGASIPVLVGFGWYCVIYRAWSAWDESAVERLVRGEPARRHIMRRALMILLGALPAHAALRFVHTGDLGVVRADLVAIGQVMKAALDGALYGVGVLELLFSAVVALAIVAVMGYVLWGIVRPARIDARSVTIEPPLAAVEPPLQAP